MKGTLLALLSISWIAAAGAQCESGAKIMEAEYPSAELAAFMALGELLHRRVQVEYGGAIVEMNGKFRYTEAVTQGKADHVATCLPYSSPGQWRVVAIYHTHRETPLFSDIDKASARVNGFPSYVATMRKAEGRYHILARYDPKTDVTTLLATAEHVRGQIKFNRYEAAPR
jgi:hypothetical protein